MALTGPQVERVWKDYADELHGGGGASPCKFTKTDLSAAAAAIDGWIDANQASFNAALPLPYRTTASASEKAALFMWVLAHRFRG